MHKCVWKSDCHVAPPGEDEQSYPEVTSQARAGWILSWDHGPWTRNIAVPPKPYLTSTLGKYSEFSLHWCIEEIFRTPDRTLVSTHAEQLHIFAAKNWKQNFVYILAILFSTSWAIYWFGRARDQRGSRHLATRQTSSGWTCKNGSRSSNTSTAGPCWQLIY